MKAIQSASERPFKVGSLVVRAVALFLVLFGLNVGILGWLVLHDYDRRVVREKILRSQQVAGEMAQEIRRQIAPNGVLEHLRVVERSEVIGQVIDRYRAELRIIERVTILDEQGRPLLTQTREGQMPYYSGQTFGGAAPPNPDAPPSWRFLEPGESFRWRGPLNERLVNVAMGRDAGSIQLAITPEQELQGLRAEMRNRLIVGAAISFILLTVAFLYVLRMVNRTRRLEAEAQQADQLAQLGTLASGLAHEIRNPLNAMNINLQMLEEELVDHAVADDSVGLLRSSRREVLRLERLVKDFLAFARPRSTRRREVAVHDLVGDTVSFLRPQFEEAGVKLEMNSVSEPPEVLVDAEQIKQALINVLQNALEVSRPGQSVVVELESTTQGEACISVVDQGPGIPDDQQQRIFEVFWSKKPAGSGLGLPIAQRALEAHGGRIEIQSRVGSGSRFRLIMPPAMAFAPQAAHPTQEASG